LVVIFLFLTAPVTAHVIGRAAYLTGTPLAPGTSPDQLAGAYDPESGRLAGLEGRPEPAARLEDEAGAATRADASEPQG
jgi:multicomponent Na+:H+ antiporter subunit G